MEGADAECTREAEVGREDGGGKWDCIWCDTFFLARCRAALSAVKPAAGEEGDRRAEGAGEAGWFLGSGGSKVNCVEGGDSEGEFWGSSQVTFALGDRMLCLFDRRDAGAWGGVICVETSHEVGDGEGEEVELGGTSGRGAEGVLAP